LKSDGTCAETRFGLSGKRTSPFKSAGVSSVEYWQPRRADQRAAVVMLDRPCSEVEVEEHCLPTPFACFPFTSPPVRHRVPLGFEWTLNSLHLQACSLFPNKPCVLLYRPLTLPAKVFKQGRRKSVPVHGTTAYTRR
jgi:hypothetical protein